MQKPHRSLSAAMLALSLGFSAPQVACLDYDDLETPQETFRGDGTATPSLATATPSPTEDPTPLGTQPPCADNKYYKDGDGDGFGGREVDWICPGEDLPEGMTFVNGDCDDSNAEIYPGADERCNDLNDDCDAFTDEGLPTDRVYLDGDHDGYGAGEPFDLCEWSYDDYSESSDDCQDDDPDVHPGADELCNTQDDDCDGEVDEDPTNPTTWYIDVDGDGYGDEGEEVIEACTQPEGYVSNGEDCGVGDPKQYPGAPEACDATEDMNCDGDVALEENDLDGDGYVACVRPDDESYDCDEGDPDVNPEADEVLNGDDDDCDGVIDEGVDDDQDGYLDVAEGGDDCQDDDPDVYPGKTEVCNGVDDDCSGVADDPPDGDGDGYTRCSEHADCDDTDDAQFPGADERCNGQDDDCDGSTDEEAIDADTYYLDEDQDGYGGEALEACSKPVGYSTTGGDCRDDLPEVKPGATETCNGLDDDCDGFVDDGHDQDNDGYPACGEEADCDDLDPQVNPGAEEEQCNDLDENCNGDADNGYEDQDGDSFNWCDGEDCDDSDPDVNPEAEEVCNLVDDNCNGEADEGLVCKIVNIKDKLEQTIVLPGRSEGRSR